MIFRKQLTNKDCYRTVIGCITDTEPQDVPDFMDGEGDFITEETFLKIRGWLRVRNLDLISSAFPIGNHSLQDILNYMQTVQGNDIIYFVIGMSNKEPHVAICRGNQIIWDPSPINSGIRNPIDGVYFIHHIAENFLRYNGPLPSETTLWQEPEDNEDSITT